MSVRPFLRWCCLLVVLQRTTNRNTEAIVGDPLKQRQTQKWPNPLLIGLPCNHDMTKYGSQIPQPHSEYLGPCMLFVVDFLVGMVEHQSLFTGSNRLFLTGPFVGTNCLDRVLGQTKELHGEEPPFHFPASHLTGKPFGRVAELTSERRDPSLFHETLNTVVATRHANMCDTWMSRRVQCLWKGKPPTHPFTSSTKKASEKHADQPQTPTSQPGSWSWT